MRFSNRITFVTKQDEYYDPSTGEYVESEPIKDTKPCKISAMGMNRLKELFGEVDEDVTIARLQRPYTSEFDYVEIGSDSYKVKQRSDYYKGVLFLERDSFAD